MTRLSGVRLLVLLQAVLLVPPLLLGSLCLRDGGAVFETGCACAFSEGAPSTSSNRKHNAGEAETLPTAQNT